MENNFKKVWSATDFFRDLTRCNKLAREKGFQFVDISGLDGLQEAIAKMQSTANFVFVSDTAAGYTDMENTPHTRRVRTVFIAMRHKLNDMAARRRCMDIIAELHRQFCSVLIREKVHFEANMQYLESRINLQEVDKYLIPGTAICMFELAVDTYIDLQYNADEWCDDEQGSGSGSGSGFGSGE